ncbi:MAG: hypothetical protein C0625_11960 [Arcobacter sp.]|nr:MAG: hypothetical protein C0625_11960 [Arcobacter sp.]
MKENSLEKEAYKLRYEFYNLYINKENKWNEKYKNHHLYKIVVESFNYRFSEIGVEMPKLLEKIKA